MIKFCITIFDMVFLIKVFPISVYIHQPWVVASKWHIFPSCLVFSKSLGNPRRAYGSPKFLTVECTRCTFPCHFLPNPSALLSPWTVVPKSCAKNQLPYCPWVPGRLYNILRHSLDPENKKLIKKLKSCFILFSNFPKEKRNWFFPSLPLSMSDYVPVN